MPPNPADLLSTGRVRKIIGEAAEAFEFVVIDGPPTLGLADAPLLAAAAGNVVFVIESGRTRTRTAIETLNRLEATDTRILGVLLTKSSESRRQATARHMAMATVGYGYGTQYGKTGGKRTEILMIAQPAEEKPEDEKPDASAPEEPAL